MYIIGFDIMGSDLGPQMAIQAGINFLKKNKNVKLIFVGDQIEILKLISQEKKLHDRYEILNTTEVIDMNGTIMDVRRKKDSSLVRTIELVRDQKVQGMLTGGNSAAFIAGSHMILGEIDGITRPGFMPTLPTVVKNKVTLLLDAGANGENEPIDLHNFAKIASIYSREVLKIAKPSVGLINIGTEEHKGNILQKETFQLLKNDNDINFYGNIETREMVAGTVDILVTDGFTGNVSLKAIEGMAKNLLTQLKLSLTKNVFRKMCALMLKKSFNELKEKFDYKNHAGALLIGINGIVFKSHGSSDVRSFEATLRMTLEAIENDVLTKIKKGI